MHGSCAAPSAKLKAVRRRVNAVDVRVGARIRLRRTMLGLSQGDLGAAIGVTFQQMQKYERGTNRVGASRLYELSRVLDVPVSFFFDSIDWAALSSAGTDATGSNPEDDPFRLQETAELIDAFSRVSDPLVRSRLLALLKALAGRARCSSRQKRS